MFLLDNQTVVYSPTDLVIAVSCEFSLLRRLDERLGRATSVKVEDKLMERAALLGDRHEQAELDKYVALHGDPVVQFPSQGDYSSAAALRSACDLTLDAMRIQAPVIYQGSFFDGRFHGRSDFLELTPEGYLVVDTKLAKKAKVTALLQLTGYADQLLHHGIPLNPQVRLVLGNGRKDDYPVGDLLAVYRHRRARMEELLDRHLAQEAPAYWAQTPSCGRCDDCQAEAKLARDVLLVAGLRVTQRAHLHDADITTVEELAASTGPVEGIGTATLGRLRHQARLQSEQDSRPELANGVPDVHAEVVDHAPLLALPAPDPGDIFFDFEGDPLWSNGDGKGGLEYLFGVFESDSGKFVRWLAHDREQEHQALRDFIDYVVARLQRYPHMHIYHYANYERAALSRLSAHAEYGEEVVDGLFRQGIMVDLYTVVRNAIRVSQPSYSIKKLEPLYMGEDLRTGLDNAGDSVAEYARYTDLVAEGNDAEAEKVLQGIEDYNEYDCRSTLGLRDWLRSQADPHAPIQPVKEPHVSAPQPDPLAEALRVKAVETDGADGQALRLLAAALGYHQREDKPFWWEHFARLREPIEDWAGSKDVFVVDDVLAASGWALHPPKRNKSRELVLAGTWGAGSVPTGKATPVFDAPVPEGFQVPVDAVRAAGGGASYVTSVDELGRDVVTLTVTLQNHQAEYDDLPVALVPDSGPNTAPLAAALRELGTTALDGLPDQPGVALLRRQLDPPLPQPSSAGDLIDTITAAVRSRIGSYVAVQGPPGTGKTYTGARVIAGLVAAGWRVGVVAQSHSVVSHFLDEVIKAGVSAARVAKKQGAAGSWTVIKDSGYAAFLASHADGCVVGGTAWDFANVNRVQRGELDLLVIDEAGQFSLANTLAASVSAKRLLLLGDPQQLPQVSQGTHPEAVNESALAWLMDGTSTLPPERGYFLAETWRMHPALCTRVSELSYDGRLHSQPDVAGARHLDGLAPGLHPRPVEHWGNDVRSHEEALEVVACLKHVLGLPWTPKADADPRPLAQGDLLVVAAYNAQVAEIRAALDHADLSGIHVGTVDKLQGREAPIVVVSLAASSAPMPHVAWSSCSRGTG